MTRVAVHAVVCLLVLHVVKASLDTKLEKRDVEDKWPVLSAILEKLFLPDECIYYTKLSSYDRSVDYNDLSSNPVCDAKLVDGWYRFTDSAGSRLATSCITKPKDMHCSAFNPGWMDGEHPSIQDGQVDRKVCFSSDGSCCQASVNIQVRNCGPFYVYYLVGVPCPFRYCGSHVSTPTTAPETILPPEPPRTTLPPFPENISTTEPTTLPPLPTESENITTTEPTTLPPETTSLPTKSPPTPRPEDECSNYTTLDEPSRAASFYNPFFVKGDHELNTGWYRFTGEAGTKMADKCVDVFHCGTNAPGWLMGGHPTNASAKAVWKTVCFSWNNNCCRFKGRIQVRECGDFFVYHLRELRVKYLRYCGNGTIIDDKNVEK